jgi:hypothetical protein
MESIGSVVAVAAVVALWIAAVWFGRDSRDGWDSRDGRDSRDARDWFARTNLLDRPHRIGD